jgi:hypothetical protein
MLTRALAAIVALGALTTATLAQPRNPGPDVIVGDLIDTSTYGTQSGSGIFAYDVGTVSCNLGNVNLRWVSNTNQHPVIGQNIYRVRNGRIEQVGMSWVKHGFFALQGNLCSTCNGQGGDVLGVGCSDPYEGGLNGDQDGLGPRSEINATTGSYIYNPSGWPAYSGAIARRIQVAQVDLDPAQNSGALYFAEGQYVTPDDASAGNGWNNASYRRMTFTSSAPYTASFPFNSTTVRRAPAIQAWRDHGLGINTPDPSVQLAPIDVPGDGRFWIGHKVSDNGNGTWHYEYAIFNMTSDRCASAFTVPIPAGATITNAQFKGPVHHSGEPYTTTAWTVTVNPTSVTFTAPQTFAQNPNARVLRWSTMFNFRFDANVAPVNGSAAIDLFKPGAGVFASMNAFPLRVQTPGGATTSVAPMNDLCAAAATAHSGVNGFPTVNATAAGPSACASAGGSADINADVWFSYTYEPFTACAGNLTIDTCGSDFDTKISVYSGSTCPSAPGTQLACSDDNGTCSAGAAGSSSVSFTPTSGTTYLIRVGSVSGTTGNGILNITPPFCIPPTGSCCLPSGACSIATGSSSCFGGIFTSAGVCSPNTCPQPAAPANDLCANAIAVGDTLVGSPSVTGTNAGALTDSATDGCFNSGLRDVWYTYTPVNSGSVTFSLCTPPASGLQFDTILSIRTACGTTETNANCDDDTCAPLSRLTRSLVAGTNYRIRVAGFGGETGDFVLTVIGGGGTVSGACCRGAICSTTTSNACTGPFTAFTSAGAACNAGGNNRTPCCRADFDHNGAASIDDLFIFLNQWFQAAPSTAVSSNGASAPNLDDIFIYLNIWFAGC